MKWLLLILCLTIDSGVFAQVQEAQDAIAISGVVTTRTDGLPVPGATVSIVGADVTTFPGTSPFGMNGRTVYGRVGYTF